ncbi:MAG: PEFG-CTERM sorting domain-containing protein, partial [Nitrosopumilaceae archaeon]|nr:PEFG-CTERM sorting domain-containing protein [Nitrosopumilaceae archaeon]NIU01052.1 PEFG-CTERM sorting domain-containing protein [Nitrosopumilaceae archaeon]NIU87488.1 PEFG-CTERM sorting domain-containing protein [Nitrosopumilaceae archaeon]NIV66689.1 PEFG-CTERM sorting domain-containing protein [Nitrosopumilaceae archaeon]NIX61654.1 PEFG-CTERM sorting domain-containing protein [Nitrosopumilaceae archaeon]
KGEVSEVSILVGKSLNNVISLQEYSGGAVEIDALQYVDEIERLLTQAKQEYRNGNTQTAFNLVSEAYLDNYEFIEGPLGEIDHELMIKIETDMREDLRNMIQSNAPVSQVDAQIDMILADMSEVRKVIPEFGTIAALILAVAIISIVAVSAKSRLSIIPR